MATFSSKGADRCRLRRCRNHAAEAPVVWWDRPARHLGDGKRTLKTGRHVAARAVAIDVVEDLTACGANSFDGFMASARFNRTKNGRQFVGWNVRNKRLPKPG